MKTKRLFVSKISVRSDTFFVYGTRYDLALFSFFFFTYYSYSTNSTRYVFDRYGQHPALFVQVICPRKIWVQWFLSLSFGGESLRTFFFFFFCLILRVWLWLWLRLWLWLIVWRGQAGGRAGTGRVGKSKGHVPPIRRPVRFCGRRCAHSARSARQPMPVAWREGRTTKRSIIRIAKQ